MGAQKSRLENIKNHKTDKIVLLGLENSGKTSIFHYLKHKSGPIYPPEPTLSYSNHLFKLKSSNIEIWDIGGNDLARSYLWKSTISGSSAIIFVLDSTDENSIFLAQQSLLEILSWKESIGLPLLILANKSDLTESEPFNSQQLVQAMSLRQLCRQRVICVQQTSTKTGYGLENAMERIYSMICQNNKILEKGRGLKRSSSFTVKFGTSPRRKKLSPLTLTDKEKEGQTDTLKRHVRARRSVIYGSVGHASSSYRTSSNGFGSRESSF